MRIEIAFINELSANVIDETNKIFSDNDDNKDLEELSDYATSSQKNQILIRDNSISEKEDF